ncbi:hypothetical protein [Liberiplasma polymorphum]|uniref:hypothetical protein n=1 Tax=Liberiplasma polymorphum TaxID=3374570 RepID=UPI003771149E
MRKIYSHYFVSWILLLYAFVWSVPIFYAFSYTFELNQYLTATIKMIVSLIIALTIAFIGITVLITKRKKYRKKVNSVYRKEYASLMILTGFGILGVAVMFLEFGGNKDYLLHLLILLFLVNYFIVLELGSHIFNVKLFQNR